MRKLIVYLFIEGLVFFIAWTCWLYVLAPVDSLRGVVTYVPPFKEYVKEAGLGVPGALTFEEIPPEMILMTMIGEDPEFPYHHGINIHKTLRGIADHFTDGVPLSGNSTITQQIAKNVFTGPDRSLYRKYIELIYALKIERHFTKAEIFTIYANMVQVGPDMYGFKEASEAYFGKRRLDQTYDLEQDFIVSNLPAPTSFSKWYRDREADPSEHNLWRMAWKLQYFHLLKDKLKPEGRMYVDDAFFTRYFHGVHIETWDKSKPHDEYKKDSESECWIFIHHRVTDQ